MFILEILLMRLFYNIKPFPSFNSFNESGFQILKLFFKCRIKMYDERFCIFHIKEIFSFLNSNYSMSISDTSIHLFIFYLHVHEKGLSCTFNLFFTILY